MSIKINNYNLKTKKLKKLNITLISDIHYYDKKDTIKLKKIVKKIKDLKPDYICIPGDLIDEVNIKDTDFLYEFLNDLSKINKVIISIGNHDISIRKNNSYSNNKDIINKIKSMNNVILLDNEVYKENNICFIGITNSIDYYYKYGESYKVFIDEINKVKLNINKYDYNILLCHSPISIINKNIVNDYEYLKKIDLILCGHMHSGLTPRFLRKKLNHIGLVSPHRKIFMKDSYGHISRNNIDYIISAGITKASHYNPIHFMDNLFSREIDNIKINKI